MPVEHGRGEVAEKQSEGTRAGELLMALASGARVFRAADGRFHARVPLNGRQAIFGLKSSAFRDWLIDGYLSAHEKLPPRRAIRRVLESNELRRLAPTLAERGLFVIFNRTETQRLIILTTRPHLHQPQAPIETKIPGG
jgi:hypothetical protein